MPHFKKQRPYFPKIKNIADSLEKVTKPFLKEGGYYYTNILLDWEKIVGPIISKNTLPLKMTFKKGKGYGATLVLQCEPAAALMIGFQKGVIIEKITAFYGKPLVQDLIFKQAPLPKNKKKCFINKVDGIIPDEISTTISMIKNTPLENALRKLGKALFK